jgi:hypothetical protein
MERMIETREEKKSLGMDRKKNMKKQEEAG